ncbi:MAG: hypothetical protein Q4A83_08495 [Bacillota bacterium]|nr:hypothetical protein [Bacillota bacterium]
MDIITLSLALLPALGAALGFFKMLTAKKMLDEGIATRRVKDEQFETRFITLCCLLVSGVLYGVLESLIAKNCFGGEIPDGFFTVILITVVLTTLSEIIKGIIGAKEIEKDSLNEVKTFNKALVKTVTADLLAIGGLMYFLISLVYV